MNGRILELVKKPDLLQINDLELLSAELNKHPYIQSLRALHLLGTHRFQPENYAAQLSLTAAYTTDKKILYQLINSGAQKEHKKEIAAKVPENVKVEEQRLPPFSDVESVVPETPKPVYVNGVLNRILFEGEEDFMERDYEVIDLESTLESGNLVLQKPNVSATVIANIATEPGKEQITQVIPPPKSVDLETQDKENLEELKRESKTQEDYIQEEKIPIVKDQVEDESVLNFHGTQEFMPDVQITPTPAKEISLQKPTSNVNKHEAEMNRLVAEVEAQLKKSKKEKKAADASSNMVENHDINFAETQDFRYSGDDKKTVAPDEEKNTEQPVTTPSPQVEAKFRNEAEVVENQGEKPAWKPMSLSSNTPDALLGQSEKEKTEKGPSVVKEQISSPVREEKAGNAADLPVYNMSFFTQNNSAEPKEEKEIPPILETEAQKDLSEESNVPSFINTWQNWLKIDRDQNAAQEKLEISITEIKNKVIENFIEKEPRISKLKEESDFVIKEKNDDISHLMTQTLANLYTEQKLYSKAIKAYGILSEKHPDKKPLFDAKIKEIKELRQTK